MDSAAHIGRIGLLAIALGVGAAIAAAVPGSAVADSGEMTTGPAQAPERPTTVRGPGHPQVHGLPRPAAVKPANARRSIAPARALPASATPPSDSPGSRVAAQTGRQSVNPVTAFFGNTTPYSTSAQESQSPTGVLTGTVTVVDPDSSAVGSVVTRAPAHGTVTLSGGQYTYTADPLLAHTGYIDSFAVTVDDSGDGFHIHGLLGLINMLTLGLLGESGHRSTANVTVNVTAFNNAPTATTRITAVDLSSGLVTGRVSGQDVNGDAVTYTGSGATAKGSVTVSNTGEFSYTPTSGALTAATDPSATAADKQDTFTVTVDDGYGGTTAVAVIVPIGQPAPAPPLSTFCGCTLMPANTVFHADVSALPVLAQSATWTSLLGGTLRAVWGGAPWLGNTAGMPVNTVADTQPTETVIFNRGLSSSGPSIDNRPYAIPDRPLVEGMPDVPAWDRHLLVLQTGTCVSQELYNVANGVELPANGVGDALANVAYAAAYGPAWIAESGVHYDMNSPLYPAQGWANASQLPYLPLILRPDDLASGSIDHMLGITIAKDRGTGYTWPARAGDGTGTNPNGVPMGTVLRLLADFDVSSYDPATQVVLRALQEHGAVIYDSGNPGQDGATLLAMSNGWSGTGYLTAQRELSTVPLSAFEAVDVLSLAMDPNMGWVIR